MIAWLRRMFQRAPDVVVDSRAEELAALAARHARSVARLLTRYPEDDVLAAEYRRAERQLQEAWRDR